MGKKENSISARMLDLVYDTALMLPPPFLEKVADCFANESEIGTEQEWSKRISELPKAHWRQTATHLVSQWRLEGQPKSGEAIATALLSAQYCAKRSKQASSAEIVWTGPTMPGVAVRRTEQVLLQLIQDTQRELVIVSFAIYKVPELTEALLEALKRGVNIKLIAETSDNSSAPFGIERGLGSEVFQKTQVYQWDKQQRPRDEKGHMGSLHAKLAISDRSQVFVTSANLTGYALSLNMEVGILLNDTAIATQLSASLDSLIQHKVLSPL